MGSLNCEPAGRTRPGLGGSSSGRWSIYIIVHDHMQLRGGLGVVFRGCSEHPVLVEDWEEQHGIFRQSCVKAHSKLCEGGTTASICTRVVGGRPAVLGDPP